MTRALVLLLVLVALLPLSARAELSEPVRQARNHFEFGRYERARQIAEDLLESNVLSTNDDRIEANRIAGLSYFYVDGNRARAETYFVQLLRIDPDYQLDPFFTTPAAIQFFDEVRRGHEAELEPIRQALARERERNKPAPGVIKTVSQRTLAVAFLPLGAGQFQNGDDTLGWVFAGVQVAAAATWLGTYLAYVDYQNVGGTVDDRSKGEALRNANWTAIGVFAAAWITSSAQAWAQFRPEVEVGTTPVGPPRRAASVTPLVSPVAGGGLLGLQMGF